MGTLVQRTLATGLPVVVLLGCSHFQQLSSGPAVSIADGRGSWGGTLVGEAVTGATSPRGGFTGLGAGARGVVTERLIDVAPFVGPYVGSSVDRTFLYGSMRFGPGLQLLDGRPLAFGALGGSFGIGYAISDTGWRHHPSWLGFEARMPVGGPDVLALQQGEDARRRTERERSRVLLTLGLAADLNFRFTRSPMPSLSALLGVAWMDEVTSSE